ncbi:MAG: cytochrome b6-f complex subunit 6 [Phormidesmis sp.]
MGGAVVYMISLAALAATGMALYFGLRATKII